MVLGRKGKDVEMFVDQLKAEGESECEGGGEDWGEREGIVWADFHVHVYR